MKMKLLFFVVMIFSMTVFAQRIPIKNVAVVETQINEQSGAASKINKAEVMEITNEIRREAVNNLPRGKFNVMTSETVLSMGDAVLEDCAEENCVIALGSKIGADYIVRGIISMFAENLTVTVEMYETEYGMLVATAAPVRTANLNELLERTTVVCAEMYRRFLETSASSVSPQAVPVQVSEPEPKLVAAAESAPDKTVSHTQSSDKDVSKKNSRWYLGLRYLPISSPAYIPIGGSLEIGKVRQNGRFFGVDFSFAYNGPYEMGGFGLNWGGINELTSELKLVYGLSGGFWRGDHYEADFHNVNEDHYFGGPFVKLQYNKYLEFSYRVLIGNKSTNEYLATDEQGNSLGLTIIANEIKFSHQLGLGFYFEF